MTINEFIRNAKENGYSEEAINQILLETNEVWSNKACRAYMIAAASAAGVDNDTINRMIETLEIALEYWTIEEAKRAWDSGEL